MAPPGPVVIVGAGIIGCASAYELAKAGCAVTVIERDTVGSEASSAAAGMLAPLGESTRSDPFQELALASWRLYPDTVAELRAVTGVDVEYTTTGTLHPLFTAEDVRAAGARCNSPLAKQMGLALLEGQEVFEREPAISKKARAALFVPGDHWVNNQRLTVAYAQAAAARGVTFRLGARVGEVMLERGRGVGVVAGGERVRADAVLITAGAWSGELTASLGSRLPVEPARGQMLALSHVPPLLKHCIHGADVYLVPRPSGELLIGATVERVGFVRAVTPEGIGSLIRSALEVVPDLADRPITRTWCGFRPWAPDSLPILGPWPGVPGLAVATAHFRNGILLAPITARLMKEVLVDGKPSLDLAPFLPDRFLK
ncbi:MAG: glycine oxidase ThiO [Candidatus Rokubacteria bacterium]|nr:glycine oxidase ThiO [Candidatus Rokubacteria bacterium]